MRLALCVPLLLISSVVLGASFQPKSHDPRPAAFSFTKSDAEAKIAAAGYTPAGKQFCPHNGLYEINFQNAAVSSFDESDCVAIKFSASGTQDEATAHAASISKAVTGDDSLSSTILELLKGKPLHGSINAEGYHIDFNANGNPDLRTSMFVIRPLPKREWTGKKGKFTATYLRHDDKTLWVVDDNGKEWPAARSALAPEDQKWLAVWEATSVY